MSETQRTKFPWPTHGGHDFYEVLSALQKSTRRGLQDDALFWSTELYLSDYADHAWNRLLVIASEDVGQAAPQISVQIKTLFDLYKLNKKSGESRLFFIHAVIALVQAPKSRLTDHATIVFFEGAREHREIPDCALDVHTTRGRAMGRGYEHFFAEGAALNSRANLEDPYEKRAKTIRSSKK